MFKIIIFKTLSRDAQTQLIYFRNFFKFVYVDKFCVKL